MCLGSRLLDARTPLAPAHARALLLVRLQVLAAALALQVVAELRRLQVSRALRSVAICHTLSHLCICAGDESGVARLTAAFEAQTIELKAVLHQVSTEDKAFTRATTGMVNQLLYKRGLREGVLALPATIGDFYPTTALSAFSWTRDGALKKAMGEPEASKVLLPLLRSFIEDGATPAVINPIVDVQNLSATAPMVVEEAGIANFKGVPDIVILRNGLDSPVGLPFSSTVVSVDWKTPEAMNERGVIQNLGYLHAIALSERTSSAVNPPAFFTDMVSRVRAWELVGSTIYALHPAQGDLTLREGVALMRFYIARADSMAAAEGPAEHDCNWRRALPLLGPASDLPSGGMGRGHSGPESSPTSAGLGKAGSKVGEASLASSPEDPTVCYSTDSSPEAELVALSLSIRAAAAELRCFGCANLDAVFGDTE